jgi:hypothetical protein
LARDVVEQRMSHQRLEPLSPCSLPSLLGNNPFPLGLLNGNPICVRGLARERLISPQGCSSRKDESSLSFTMLLRLESLFPFSFSPPFAGGNIVMVKRYSPRF